MNIHTFRVNIHTLAHSRARASMCLCNVLKHACGSPSAMVQIFTPPSVNIHTSSVNIHTSAHSPVCVRSCSCNVRCVEACLWMSSTMVHSFTPPSVNIHTHSVNIHTPAHSHVCVRSCNVLEYDMDLLRHALGASTPPHQPTKEGDPGSIDLDLEPRT